MAILADFNPFPSPTRKLFSTDAAIAIVRCVPRNQRIDPVHVAVEGLPTVTVQPTVDCP